MSPIYLDSNATTPLLPEAWEAMRPLMMENFGNPSSAHRAGRKARQALEDARERIAFLLGASPNEVTFTSGATEANNLAVFGLLNRAHHSFLSGAGPHPPAPSPRRRGGYDYLPLSPGERGPGGEGEPHREPRGEAQPHSGPGGEGEQHWEPRGEAQPHSGPGGEGEHLLASHLEHPCVVEPLRQLGSRGFAVEWLPISGRGMLLPETIRAALRPETKLVCIMLANHETGAIQSVREIATVLPPEVALHCDAAQAVGKIPVCFRELGVTTLTASAHKFGGPKGIGVLIAKRGTKLAPLVFGGHQQQGRRPGTEPVPLAAGMAAALEWAVRNMAPNHAKLAALRERLWTRLLECASPIVLNGPEIGAADVVPTTLNVSFPTCRADLLLMALDLAGVACSTGSACSSGSLLPSPVLAAMGVPDSVLRSALRFSFGPTLELADIDAAANRIASVLASAHTIPS